MFVVECQKNQAKVRHTEPITSGSQNVYVVQFKLSEEWDPLVATAVFMAGNRIINVLLDEDRECMIPWEVMQYAGDQVMVGVFGTMNGNVVLPTVWASMGNLQQGVTTGIYGGEPTPTVYQQIVEELRRIRDRVEYGIPYALEGIVDTMVVSVNDISKLTLPRNVIMLNSGFKALDGESKSYLNAIVYLEDVVIDNQTHALQVTDYDGNVYRLFYRLDSNGSPASDFLNIVKVRDGNIRTPYELAVANGFDGTEEEWLDSLKAPSPYELAVANGFDGTEEEWLESLKGSDGIDGADGLDGTDGADGKSAYWINASSSTKPSVGGTIVIQSEEWNALPTDANQIVNGTIGSNADASEPFLYFVIAKTVEPITESEASITIERMASLIVDVGDITPKLINLANTTKVLNDETITDADGNTAGVESLKAIAAWVSDKLDDVVDPEHGGTGETSLANAVVKLIDGLTYIGSEDVNNLDSDVIYAYNGAYIPLSMHAAFASESVSPRKTTIEQLMTMINGYNAPVTTPGSDYTKLRARAISLNTTMPTDGLVNGALYGVY